MRATAFALAILALLSGLVVAGTGSARADYPRAGSIYLSFSPTSHVPQRDIQAGERFEFYLVIDLREAANRLNAYEVNVRLDPEILFGGMNFTPASSINVGGGFANGQMDLIVGTGECIKQGLTPLAVVHFEGLLLEDADDVFIDLGPATRSSVGGEGPAWATCAGEDSELYLFDVPSGELAQQLVINSSSGIATEKSSWSALKALYED